MIFNSVEFFDLSRMFSGWNEHAKTLHCLFAVGVGYLKVQMHELLAVHVRYPKQYLDRVVPCFFLAHQHIIFHNLVKKFSAAHTVKYSDKYSKKDCSHNVTADIQFLYKAHFAAHIKHFMEVQQLLMIELFHDRNLVENVIFLHTRTNLNTCSLIPQSDGMVLLGSATVPGPFSPPKFSQSLSLRHGKQCHTLLVLVLHKLYTAKKCVIQLFL